VGIISLVIVGLLIGAWVGSSCEARTASASATLAAGVAGAILGATISGFLGLGVISIVPELAISVGLVISCAGEAAATGSSPPWP